MKKLLAVVLVLGSLLAFSGVAGAEHGSDSIGGIGVRSVKDKR